MGKRLHLVFTVVKCFWTGFTPGPSDSAAFAPFTFTVCPSAFQLCKAQNRLTCVYTVNVSCMPCPDSPYKVEVPCRQRTVLWLRDLYLELCMRGSVPTYQWLPKICNCFCPICMDLFGQKALQEKSVFSQKFFKNANSSNLYISLTVCFYGFKFENNRAFDKKCRILNSKA